MSEPEREGLTFEICADNLDEQSTELILSIKKVAESILYHWKSFPIVLPTPVAVQNESPSSVYYGSETESNRTYEITSNQGREESNSAPFPNDRIRPLILKDVFITPSFDELDAVAVDTKGECRKLGTKHLSSIHQKGEFEVDSLHFPGQKHRWRVSECLQKGTERIYETFLEDLANVASLLIITAKNRVIGNSFSLKESGYALWNGVLGIIDLIFGIQWVQAHNLDARIKEERCNYLVQELTSQDGDVDELCTWVFARVKRAKREKFQLNGAGDHPQVPYLFTTPQGLSLNLKLFNREVIKKMLPILIGILEKESRGWFLHFREKTISELKSKGLNENQVEKEGNRIVQEEYLSRVYRSILEHPTLQELEDIPQLLIDQAKAVLLMHQALDEIDEIYGKAESACVEDLRCSHPVLSRIKVWMEEHLSSNHKFLEQEHKWRPHEHAMALCREQNLPQHVYFLQRDLAFMRERESVLLKELRSIQVPTRVFEWKTQIWCPQSYIVSRTFQGESDVIPTILALAPTSITTPRSDPCHPVYQLEKQVTYTTSTRWPFWRWFNFLHRSWTWTYNAVFMLAVWVPMCSPFSLRTLFTQHPFMPEYELSQVNGTVCPSKVSMTPTLSSRLINLWRHISKSRTHFESTPDTGFIGKGLSRHLNRLWNYLLKGVLGTLLLTTVFPILCIIISVGSFLLALAAPIWAPACVVATHLSFILFYDFDSPSGDNKWLPLLRVLIWNFLCVGIIQPILAFIFAIIVCPILASVMVLYAYGRRGVRNVWDKVMFHGVIKKKGRIPSSDSFLVKRVAGPGLHDNFTYQISCEQALAAFESRLELDELILFEKNTEELISQPLVSYGEFIHRCFGPFSGVIGRIENFSSVEKEVRDLNRCLCEKLERRRNELLLPLPDSAKSKIKMRTADLKTCLKQATIILEEFYPQRILKHLIIEPESIEDDTPESSRNSELLDEISSILRQGTLGRPLVPDREKKNKSSPVEKYHSMDAWWESRGLTPGDYASLASLIFTEIFSPEFLTPLEEKNTTFQMEVQGINLSRYTEMIRRMPERKDLDDKLSIHTPRGNIKIHAPYLDLSCFTPLVRHSVPTAKTKKASLAARLSLRLNPGRRLASASRVPEKLLIPPPVPHPAHISIIIHNRDAAESIPLEDSSTKAVLRSIENAPHLVSISPSRGLSDRFGLPSVESSSAASSPNLSVYDDPSMYWHHSGSRTGTTESKRRTGGGRSRMATLEISETVPKRSSLDSRKSSKKHSSSAMGSLSQRSSGWLSSPLRILLESQRPFSVALNLANAEDDTDETPSDATGGAQGSPQTQLTYTQSEDQEVVGATAF